MNLVWLITFQTLSFNFTFTARHVPQINAIADSLSRFQMSLFRLLDQMHYHASSLSDPYIFLAKFNHASCLSKLLLHSILVPLLVAPNHLGSAILCDSAFSATLFLLRTSFYLSGSPP